MRKEFREKIKVRVVPFLFNGLKGKNCNIVVMGFRRCPYNKGKPCHAKHKITISNKKILDTVTKLFLDKIK